MTNTWPYQAPPRLEAEPPNLYLARCLGIWGARAALARLIPCQPGIVGLWCSGQLVPRGGAAETIERLLGIPASEWPGQANAPRWDRVEWTGGDPATALREALGRRGAKGGMARLARLTPMQMTRVCSGLARPSIAQARVFERELGIPWAAWFRPEDTRLARERETWHVGSEAGRALLAWCDEWDHWCLPAASWHRLAVKEERLRALVAGELPTDVEMERAEMVAGVPRQAWAQPAAER